MRTEHLPGYVHPRRWRREYTAAFTVRRDDIRELLVIDHPWAPSEAGGYGEWSVRVKAPDGRRPGDPLFVSFYQSDNYTGDRQDRPGLGVQSSVGHRFKQLLVDGEAVWEQDVADEELVGDGSSFSARGRISGYTDAYRVVDITAHARAEMVLTVRVVDKVASTTPLPDDHYKRFAWSAQDPAAAARNLQTTVYFGDVCLCTSGEAVRPEVADAEVPARTPPARSAPRSARLDLTAPGPLPKSGCPARSGLPLPRGWARPGTSFALRDSRGRDVPAAIAESEHWPDGSIRWLLCEFVARRRGGYRLVPGGQPVRPEQPVRVRGRGDTLTISNGPLRLRFDSAAGTGLFDRVALTDGVELGPVELSIKLNRVGWRDQFIGRRGSVAVERASPVCAVVRVDGEMLDADGNRFGPWRARLTVWEGVPWVQVDWRLVNESDQAMAMLLDWSARVSLPDLAGAEVDFGAFTSGYDPNDTGIRAMGHHGEVVEPRALPLFADSELSCRQERADQARIYRNTSWVATAEQAAGFVNLRHPKGGVAASMRWFAEEFPKGFIVRPDLLGLATMPEYEGALGWTHDRPSVRIGRGEAKRQSFTLWLHDGELSASEAERFSRCVQDPPRLFAQDWFIDSGALEAGPPRQSPELAAWDAAMTARIEETGILVPRLGHREYWDTAWCNDYRGRAHLGLLQFAETADPRWLRYFEAACTHARDIDIIHFCPEHPEWVGLTHQYGEDHTSGGPMSNIGLNIDSLLEHYLLTGAPDSIDAAAGLAEHLLTCEAWARSARAVGWPLAQVVRWYEHSGDERFLGKAGELFAAARAYIEPRRGIFTEPAHGCCNYRGCVPFMTGYLAFGLIRYHRLTEDAEALHLLRLVADGVLAETRVGPGRFRYSPFPELNFPTQRPRSWSALVGGLAGYLHQVTGEAQYLDWARECHDAIVEDSDDPQPTMDMLQLAAWMLHAIAHGPVST